MAPGDQLDDKVKVGAPAELLEKGKEIVSLTIIDANHSRRKNRSKALYIYSITYEHIPSLIATIKKRLFTTSLNGGEVYNKFFFLRISDFRSICSMRRIMMLRQKGEKKSKRKRNEHINELRDLKWISRSSLN